MKTGKIENIMVPLQVILGETEVSVKKLADIGEGSIIELKSMAGEPVNLVAAGQLIAKGEVVVINENFGIRVTTLIQGEDA
jgi:flagellar motor switch protein FliN/FliY